MALEFLGCLKIRELEAMTVQSCSSTWALPDV